MGHTTDIKLVLTGLRGMLNDYDIHFCVISTHQYGSTENAGQENDGQGKLLGITIPAITMIDRMRKQNDNLKKSLRKLYLIWVKVWPGWKLIKFSHSKNFTKSFIDTVSYVSYTSLGKQKTNRSSRPTIHCFKITKNAEHM